MKFSLVSRISALLRKAQNASDSQENQTKDLIGLPGGDPEKSDPPIREDHRHFKIGQVRECRRSSRRQTLAPIDVVEGPKLSESSVATNVSNIGAFIRTNRIHPIGTRLRFRLELPTGARHALHLGGKVARVDDVGMGIQFDDIQTRDLSKLRNYTGFAEMDDSVVRVQKRLDGTLAGNLLPVSDQEIIEQRLRTVADRRLKVMLMAPSGKDLMIWGSIGLDGKGLRLYDLQQPLEEEHRAVYIIVFDGPLHLVFEGLVVEPGPHPRILFPERVYHNERRASNRDLVIDTWMEIDSPHLQNGPLRLPVVDLSEGGCSIRAPKSSLLVQGMRFPSFRLQQDRKAESHTGAIIKRMSPIDAEEWLVGLDFTNLTEGADDPFSRISDRSVQPTMWTTLSRISGVAKDRLRKIVVGKGEPDLRSVCVTRCRNDRGDEVVSLLNANFDLHDAPPDVDVAVIVAPAFLKRKEVFSLLARTLVDNFEQMGIKGVVLRFDATHTVGESTIDPELQAQDRPYYRWNFSILESDMLAAMRHADRRFKPKKRVVVTFSVAAIAARRMIADGETPPTDLWVAPFGCPDAQDMFRNYFAGVDLFQNYLRGETAQEFMIYGRIGDPNAIYPDSIKRKMAFLEQAREDMEKITCPVTWIVGTYDYLVTRSRVRQLLNAPGGGTREVFEMASGHVLKTGNEAIESFKLIAESIARHLFDREMEACEPDLAIHARQMDAEWARVKRSKFTDAAQFWNRHLFGATDGVEGYDVLRYNPDYMDCMRQEAELLNVQPGDRVADIGCGTGLFSGAMLDRLTKVGYPIHLTCTDLVPAAVHTTLKKHRQKIEEMKQQGAGAIAALDGRVVDLETARLSVIRDFLQGRLYGVEALSGRVEGLYDGTIRKLSASYGPDLHRILRGMVSDEKTVRRLCPSLDTEEIRIVLEFSRASRFLRDRLVPEDVLEGRAKAESTLDLKFHHLSFGAANRECRIDLESEAFDRVGCSIVVSYLVDPLSALKEFHRILAPGGTLVVSSLKPNFDASKSYLEEAKAIAEDPTLDPEKRTRLLNSLREFASFIGCVLELEDEGRFRFLSADELKAMTEEAGFEDVRQYEGMGRPPTAVIVRARKAL